MACVSSVIWHVTFRDQKKAYFIFSYFIKKLQLTKQTSRLLSLKLVKREPSERRDHIERLHQKNNWKWDHVVNTGSLDKK